MKSILSDLNVCHDFFPCRIYSSLSETDIKVEASQTTESEIDFSQAPVQYDLCFINPSYALCGIFGLPGTLTWPGSSKPEESIVAIISTRGTFCNVVRCFGTFLQAARLVLECFALHSVSFWNGWQTCDQSEVGIGAVIGDTGWFRLPFWYWIRGINFEAWFFL